MANEYTYRADHVGSLLLPPALVEARAKHARGDVSTDDLREATNAAIKTAVEMQRSAGIAVTTDGGFRRADAVPVDGTRLATSEAAFLRATTRRPIKVAVPAPRPDANEPLAAALDRAGIVKKEIEALIAAGVDYIQLEVPGYAPLLDPQQRSALQAQGVDPDRRLDELLKLDASAFSGIERPANVRVAAHIDPGTAASVWRSMNGREALAERLFTELPVDRFLLPFDSTSPIDFEPLRLVPKGKLVVLGLVSATNPALEDVDKLMAQIDLAAKSIDGDNLALSPASGFALAGKVSQVSGADQRRKLELVADVATRWWGFAM
jgi:5-methyltetrahydropteroyltriglutamate--homocysteine methyltransferase